MSLLLMLKPLFCTCIALTHTNSIFSLVSFFNTDIAMIVAQINAAQQQKFKATPHDLQVLEGSEAVLRCEVSNLAGQVQWTKDGFALGKFWLQIYFRLLFFICVWNVTSYYIYALTRTKNKGGYASFFCIRWINCNLSKSPFKQTFITEPKKV